MDLKNQRRLAAELLGCGVNRVYVNPEWSEDISGAVTKEDVRRLIKAGAIYAKQKKGISRGRTRARLAQRAKGRRKGPGSRRGSKYARYPRKERWIQTIRPIRELLAKYKKDGVLDKHQYREFYRLAKGGAFKDKAHLTLQLRTRGVIKGTVVEAKEKKPKLKTIAKIKKVKAKPEAKAEVKTEAKTEAGKTEVVHATPNTTASQPPANVPMPTETKNATSPAVETTHAAVPGAQPKVVKKMIVKKVAKVAAKPEGTPEKGGE